MDLIRLAFCQSPHGDIDHIGEAINLVEKVVFNCSEFYELEQELKLMIEVVKKYNERTLYRMRKFYEVFIPEHKRIKRKN